MIKNKIFQTNGHYIDGFWENGDGKPFDSMNPVDGSIIWSGHEATDEEIARACKAAHIALASWANLSVENRAHYLQNFAQEIERKRSELAYLISLETGKPLWEAHTEVASVITKIPLSIQAYQERTAMKEIKTADSNALLRFKPHGLVAVFGAFNFPAHLSNGHIVPALLAGNTVVYKPSELTPAVGAFIAQCWHESGLPKGVLNVLQGSAESGKALLKEDIQAVYFTGSYQTGKQIHRFFSERPDIILALEMGGNNPLIIHEITDRKAALYNTLLSTVISAGQRCTCARRVMIPNNHEGDVFLSELIKAYQKLTIGSFTQQPEPFMGPVIGSYQAIQHLNAQQNLINQGGHSLLPMQSIKENSGFLTAGIIDMTNANEIIDEEIFAPLTQIYRFDTFEEAVYLANKTHYGLAAALFSDKQELFSFFYQHIRAGLINFNRPTTGASSHLPFGGVGASGNHRPSAYFAADYCSYPIASLEQSRLTLPPNLLPGIHLE